GTPSAQEAHGTSFRKSRNLAWHGGPRPCAQSADGGRAAYRALPRLPRRLLEAGSRWHRHLQPGLPGMRLRGLGEALVGYGTRAAAPLRRGSPAASFGVTRLTPPKK